MSLQLLMLKSCGWYNNWHGYHWINTLPLDCKALQSTWNWDESISNHAWASLLPWYREDPDVNNRTHCQTKEQVSKWILEQYGAFNQLTTIIAYRCFNWLVSLPKNWHLKLAIWSLSCIQKVSFYHFSFLESSNLPDGTKRGIQDFKSLQVFGFAWFPDFSPNWSFIISYGIIRRMLSHVVGFHL